MVCLYCDTKTGVINSRHQKKTNRVWRRRSCTQCNALFTTTETIDTLTSLLVQTANDLRPFSRDYLLLSIYDSLKHRKTAITDATALTDTIFSLVLSRSKQPVIQRNSIVDASLEVLNRFDKVGATHYGAFHPYDDHV
jgi:transcriptional repressor NrdR